jgi:hypothetical protein
VKLGSLIADITEDLPIDQSRQLAFVVLLPTSIMYGYASRVSIILPARSSA